jgi:F-type H+-transporting ATPase subunit b
MRVAKLAATLAAALIAAPLVAQPQPVPRIDYAAERAAIADVRKTAATAAAAAAAQLIAAHHDAKADAALIDQSIAALN